MIFLTVRKFVFFFVFQSKRKKNCFSLVLRPLNLTAKMKLVMKPHLDQYKRPMFDIKVDLDDINLNINRDQVGF